MKKAVIRCDASDSHGRGHLSRCLAIAESLICNGNEVIFMTARKTSYFEKGEDMNF